jgi:hypothetical protein
VVFVDLAKTVERMAYLILGVGALVSGGVYAFWVGFKASAAAPASSVSGSSSPR